MAEEHPVETKVRSFKIGDRTFTLGGCKGRVVTTEDGKRHFELECKSKEDRDEVVAIFEEEAILRINPKVILEDSPIVEPEEVTPVTES